MPSNAFLHLCKHVKLGGKASKHGGDDQAVAYPSTMGTCFVIDLLRAVGVVLRYHHSLTSTHTLPPDEEAHPSPMSCQRLR